MMMWLHSAPLTKWRLLGNSSDDAVDDVDDVDVDVDVDDVVVVDDDDD